VTWTAVTRSSRTVSSRTANRVRPKWASRTGRSTSGCPTRVAPRPWNRTRLAATAGARRAALVGQGFPTGFADAHLAMEAAAVGHPAAVTGVVAEVLGRPARSFADWAAEHTGAFGPVAAPR
jgi:hypothetical protein